MERWEPLGGYRVVASEGGWAIEPVPSGWIRALVVVPGHPQRWTEPVEAAEDSETRVPPVRLAEGTELVVRVESPEILRGGESVEFDVVEEGRRRVAHTSKRGRHEGEWVLSAFAPGTYRIYAKGEPLGVATVTIGEGEPVVVVVLRERRG